MDTRSKKEVGDPYNKAVVQLLRNKRDELKITNKELEDRSGINVRTINRLLMDQSPLTIPYYMALVNALEFEDAAEPWDRALEAVKEAPASDA